MSSPDFNKLNALTDDELVRLAQSGDRAALNAVLVRYAAMVKRIASCSFGASLEPDDLAQEGMLGLLAAVYSYAPEKAASFHTYASVCVSNRIMSAVRADNRLKHSPLNSFVPLNETDVAPNANPEDLVLAAEKAEQLLLFLSEELSQLENHVLRLHLSGECYERIAEKLQISVKAVDNALQRVRKKLKLRLQEGS